MPSFNKFSFTEMTSNSCGKTSPSICAALFLIIPCGCVGLLYGTFTLHVEIAGVGVGVITLGTGLLGIRRFTPDKKLKEEEEPKEEITT